MRGKNKCEAWSLTTSTFNPLFSCGQVAGRLHVEVVRVGGGLEDNMAGGDEPDNNQDSEVQDRKLVCMVRQRTNQLTLTLTSALHYSASHLPVNLLAKTR